MQIKIAGSFTIPILYQQNYQPYQCNVDLTVSINDKDLAKILSTDKSIMEKVFGGTS